MTEEVPEPKTRPATDANATRGRSAAFGGTFSQNDSPIVLISGPAAPAREERGPTTKGFHNTVDKAALASLSATEKMRQEVIFELIDTERSYVADLKNIIELFLRPIHERGLLSREDMGQLFFNLETLYDLNTMFLSDLEDLQKKNYVVDRVGPVLLTRIDNFKMYAVYCSNAKQSNFDRLKARESKFAAFVDECSQRPEWRGVPIHAYLHKPIARVCKYPLILKELLKHTDQHNEDYPAVVEAYEKLISIVDRINERTRQVEMMNRLEEIEKSIEGGRVLALAQLTRRLVRETSVRDIKRDEMYLFLFNDLLVFCKTKKRKYELKRWAALYAVQISEESKAERMLEIVWSVEGAKEARDYVEFATVEERNAWRAEAVALIEVNNKQRIEQQSITRRTKVQLSHTLSERDVGTSLKGGAGSPNGSAITRKGESTRLTYCDSPRSPRVGKPGSAREVAHFHSGYGGAMSKEDMQKELLLLQAERETMSNTISTLKQVINGFKEQMAELADAKAEAIRQLEKTLELRSTQLNELRVQLAAVEQERDTYRRRVQEYEVRPHSRTNDMPLPPPPLLDRTTTRPLAPVQLPTTLPPPSNSPRRRAATSSATTPDNPSTDNLSVQK